MPAHLGCCQGRGSFTAVAWMEYPELTRAEGARKLDAECRSDSDDGFNVEGDRLRGVTRA